MRVVSAWHLVDRLRPIYRLRQHNGDQHYEDKITELERRKIILGEQLAAQAEPKASNEVKLEPVLVFLASPWQLWESGNIHLRRTVLKLAFADRIEYVRNQGPRTPEIALPFKALGGFEALKVRSGAGGEH